jgi:hypothetical protein
MEEIARIYRRAFALTRDWPWLIAVPVLGEALQHVAEIRVGMYSTGMDAGGRSVRLGFGILKIAAIVGTLIVAWRLWRFEGDTARALRPTARLAKGVGAFILVQIVGDLLALGAGRGLIALAQEPARATQAMLVAAPLVGWLLLSAALFPWYVGLAVEDEAMTLGRALRAARRRLLAIWGLLFAGFLPLLIVHYALAYAAIHGVPAWPVMIVDALVVGLLTAALAATYYTLYQRTP